MPTLHDLARVHAFYGEGCFGKQMGFGSDSCIAKRQIAKFYLEFEFLWWYAFSARTPVTAPANLKMENEVLVRGEAKANQIVCPSLHTRARQFPRGTKKVPFCDFLERASSEVSDQAGFSELAVGTSAGMSAPKKTLVEPETAARRT